MKLLLDHGADASGRSAAPPYRDALSLAIMRGNDEGAALLIERGADIEARDAAGDGPLGWAATSGDATIAAALIKSGAKINVRAPYSPRRTPLMIAAAWDKLDVARVLLNSGAHPNVRDDADKTALHLAAEHGDVELVRLLLEHGADPRAADGDGQTPADYARRHNRKDALALLEAAAARR
jgi:ankyrin repeat protein